MTSITRVIDDFSSPALVLDDCNATTGWTAIADSTSGISTSAQHVYGTASVEFDKVDGSGGTFGAVYKELSSIDISDYTRGANGYIVVSSYVSSIADIEYMFFRLGDAYDTNYNEWRVPDTEIVAGWNLFKIPLREFYNSIGTGLDDTDVDAVVFGYKFDSESDTLANILIDGIALDYHVETNVNILDESISVDDGDSTLSIDDGAGSITVDGTIDIAASGTIKRAIISGATSGNNTLIAAVSGKKIKVLSLILVATGDVDVRFEDGAGGTALTGVMSLAADGNGFVLPPALPGYHWMETSVNTLLNMELSDAVQCSGCIVYYEEA